VHEPVPAPKTYVLVAPVQAVARATQIPLLFPSVYPQFPAAVPTVIVPKAAPAALDPVTPVVPQTFAAQT
jgi:hypothetical protein